MTDVNLPCEMKSRYDVESREMTSPRSPSLYLVYQPFTDYVHMRIFRELTSIQVEGCQRIVVWFLLGFREWGNFRGSAV